MKRRGQRDFPINFFASLFWLLKRWEKVSAGFSGKSRAPDGPSPAEMQAAFKYLYDHTVSDFVKDVHLEKAEELIATTDLTISEVVYAAGVNSSSYFSKIVKAKYKYSPKRFKSRN